VPPLPLYETLEQYNKQKLTEHQMTVGRCHENQDSGEDVLVDEVIPDVLLVDTDAVREHVQYVGEQDGHLRCI